jgi:hypothetical protein
MTKIDRERERIREMTVKQFEQMLKTSRERLVYFWKYRTEQRRHTGTSVPSSTIKTAMQRGKGKYN